MAQVNDMFDSLNFKRKRENKNTAKIQADTFSIGGNC